MLDLGLTPLQMTRREAGRRALLKRLDRDREDRINAELDRLYASGRLREINVTTAPTDDLEVTR